MNALLLKAYPILLELHRQLADGSLSQEFFNLDEVQDLVSEIEEEIEE